MIAAEGLVAVSRMIVAYRRGDDAATSYLLGRNRLYPRRKVGRPRWGQRSRYYSPGLLSAGLAVAGVCGAVLTEGDGHLTIMVCENSEQRGGRRCHRR